MIVEFEPDTGKIVHEWHLADYFHPQTNPADSNICPLAPAFAVPVFMYTSFGDVKDWTHANAVVLDEKRNVLIVSSRHMNAVLAIRYADDATASPVTCCGGSARAATSQVEGSGELQYYQHAVEVQDDGSILLYDNGNMRPGTDLDSPDISQHPYSRAVLFSLDEANKTVTQKWEMRSLVDGRPLWAFFVGDADHSRTATSSSTTAASPIRPASSSLITEVEPTGTEGGTSCSSSASTNGGLVHLPRSSGADALRRWTEAG